MGRVQAEALFNRHRQRMRAVLRDRFGLVLRAETREMPIYAPTVGKTGHKLRPPRDAAAGPHLSTNR
jgi:uncharacterized protein (TIGR03435 family)